MVVEAGQVDGGVATTSGWAALVAAMLLAAALWWLYFDSAAEINLKVLELSGGSPTIARAIFAVPLWLLTGWVVMCAVLTTRTAGAGEDPDLERYLGGRRRR